MKRILADTLPLKDSDYDTPDAAMRYAQRFDEERQKDNLSLVIDGLVHSVEFGDDGINMYITQHGISCYHIAGKLDYAVFSGAPKEPLGTKHLDDSVVLQVRGREFAWERKRILNQFIGRNLRNVFVSPDGLFVYGSNKLILHVTTLMDLERSKQFLYWELTD